MTRLRVASRCEAWHGEGEGLLVEHLGDEALHRRDRQREHSQVDVSRPEPFEQRGGLVLVKEQLEVWQLPLQGRRHPRQQVRPDRRDQRNPQLARQGIALGLRQLDDRVRFLQHAAGSLDHLLAGRGQRYPPGLALDQRHAEVALELADLGGQGRLADETPLRRAAEMPLIGEGNEVAEVAQVHGGRISEAIVYVYGTDKNNSLDVSMLRLDNTARRIISIGESACSE